MQRQSNLGLPNPMICHPCNPIGPYTHSTRDGQIDGCTNSSFVWKLTDLVWHIAHKKLFVIRDRDTINIQSTSEKKAFIWEKQCIKFWKYALLLWQGYIILSCSIKNRLAACSQSHLQCERQITPYKVELQKFPTVNISYSHFLTPSKAFFETYCDSCYFLAGQFVFFPYFLPHKTVAMAWQCFFLTNQTELLVVALHVQLEFILRFYFFNWLRLFWESATH